MVNDLMTFMNEIIRKSIIESSILIKNSVSLTPYIEKTIKIIIKCIQNGNKIVLFGNGGSAADAQHIAAEFIGRFKINRKSFSAIALTSNSSIITSIANDYSFEDVFGRQCESLVNAGDVVIGISTSGNSKNVRKGLQISKRRKATTIGLLGNKGGQIKKVVDIPIIVDSSSTPKIQEVHRVLSHIICEIVEKRLSKNKNF